MRTSPGKDRKSVADRVQRLLAIPYADRSSVDSERPVSRTTLRRVLLDGLDGVVHFGKKFVSFEDAPDGRVNARFADGSSVASDLIVGADGASSVVRAQLLPEAGRIEMGIVEVGGRLPLSPEVLALSPEAIMRGQLRSWGRLDVACAGMEFGVAVSAAKRRVRRGNQARKPAQVCWKDTRNT